MAKPIKLGLDGNIEPVTSNNTYLDIVKIFASKFFLTKKVKFSQVNVISKFLNLMIFNFFEFIKYFDDVQL